MESQLKPGVEGNKAITVTLEKTASAYGSGTVEVFATPAMIALMEQTAMESVAAFLEDGCITVGTEVHVSHLKATGIGKQVQCKTLLNRVEGKKLTFALEAWDDQGKIGSGVHTRYIVDKQRFMSKISPNINQNINNISS